MPGSYVAFNLLPSDPFDLLASCIVSLTQRINKYVCMYVIECNGDSSVACTFNRFICFFFVVVLAACYELY